MTRLSKVVSIPEPPVPGLVMKKYSRPAGYLLLLKNVAYEVNFKIYAVPKTCQSFPIGIYFPVDL
jgi:hypothetical protein